MVCFAKKFYFKKKNYFGLNQIDLGPVSDRIKPNQKMKKKKKKGFITNTRAATSTDAWRFYVCRSRVLLCQRLHGESVHVRRTCAALEGPLVLSNLTHSCTRKPSQNCLVLQTFNPCFLLLQTKL